MSFRKRLLVLLLLVLLAAALNALFAPAIVAHGVRLWIVWAARQEGLSGEMEKVEAPFWRAVTIRNLRFTSAGGAAREIFFQAPSVVVDLNFRGRILGRDESFLRSIMVERLEGKVHVAPGSAPVRELNWRQLAHLVPENFRIGNCDLDATTGTTAVSFRGVLLSASAVESGKFFARRLSVTAPLLRQTFTNLRGATSWEGARLTIAGIPLVEGLDLETLTFDLSRLARRRLGIDLHLDAYGGSLRASFQGRAGEKFAVDVAGSAANISLTQLSKALGFLEPVTGAVRASKFTFRGHPGEFLDATASIWMEATEFAWRARRADSVMLGATYYDRRLELDQLYVRQRQNELTINGELLWPKQPSNWAQLPFRGLLNATIPDLNGFAQLFGATTGDFTGALLAHGNFDALDPEAHGQVKVEGKGVKFRGVTVDSLGAALQLKGTELTLENLEARHAEDFLRANGSIDLAAAHRFSGRLTGAINDLGAYAPLLPAAWRSSTIAGGATFDWRGDGTLAAHSGTMQFFAHGLRLPVAPLRLPLDLSLEGSYSPQEVFFRTFRIANDRVSLGGFLMLGSNFVELQALQLTLDGTPRVSGTLFLPLSFNRWRLSRSWLAAFDAAQKFDVDLAVDHLDLGGLAQALGEESIATGVLDGRLAAFGPLRTLQLTTEWRLEDFGSIARDNSIDFQGRYSGGRAEGEGTAMFGVSAPLTWRASLPLQLEKSHLADGTVLDPVGPASGAIECPALFLETLPSELRPGAGRGLLAGDFLFSGSLGAPAITGSAQLSGGRFLLPAPWPELSGVDAQLRFGNNAAEIDSLWASIDATPTSWRGQLTFTPSTFGLVLEPRNMVIELAGLPEPGANLSGVRILGQGSSTAEPRLLEARVRGRIGDAAGSLTIDTRNSEEAVAQTTLFVRPRTIAGSPLLLRILVPNEPTLGRPGDAALPR